MKRANRRILFLFTCWKRKRIKIFGGLTLFFVLFFFIGSSIEAAGKIPDELLKI